MTVEVIKKFRVLALGEVVQKGDQIYCPNQCKYRSADDWAGQTHTDTSGWIQFIRPIPGEAA